MKYNLLGVEIDPLGLDEIISLISSKVANRERLIIASQNLHSIYIYHRNQALQNLHQIAIKRVDGMPIIYHGKLLGYPLEKEQRITWVDLIWPLMRSAASSDWKIFYLGADTESVTKGVDVLKQELPKLDISFRDGFFDAKIGSEENIEVINLVNRINPDILIVGMGMPRQEKWIVENHKQLNARVIMTCGAAIEYVAGTVNTPPRWMGRSGLEWLYRLGENPRRFAFRYMIEPWYVAMLAVKDLSTKYILRREL